MTMATTQKQTRRCVSVRGATYLRIKKYVQTRETSISGFVEEVVREKLGPPTDEDCRKFGEETERREKAKEAEKAAKAAKAAKEQDEFADYVPPIQFF